MTNAPNDFRPQTSGETNAAALALTPVADNLTDIVGQYEAFVVVTYVDNDRAERALPSGFQLAPPAGTPAGMHPVMYAFGEHRHVHNVGLKMIEYDYDEALIGLPHVAIPRGNQMVPGFFSMIDVRLESRTALAVGKALGFPKRLAAITNTDTYYEIADNSRVLVRAHMAIAGRKFKDDQANFKVTSPMMQLPVASRTLVGIITTSFSIDTANAFMVPAKMEVEVLEDSIAGLPKGTHAFDSIDTAAFGGAYMSIHSWRMTQRPNVV